MKTLPLGSVGTGLTPNQTLIICLALLSDVAPKIAAAYKTRPVVNKAETNAEMTTREISSLSSTTNAIIRDLNHHVPPLTYFGYQPSDYNRNIGVWIDTGALHKAEYDGKLTQSNGSWKGIKSAYILDINNEGLTLYRRRGKKALWSVKLS